MRLLEEYRDAMDVQTYTEARLWMAAQVREFLHHWQHDAVGWDQARGVICINLAYAAGMHGPEAQQRVYDLYGAVHPSVLALSKEERRGRQFPFEFSDIELRVGAERWIAKANGCVSEESTIPVETPV